jgi:hypothetical protein
MRTIQSLLVLATCLASTNLLHADDKPQAVIEKAITALGGADRIARLRTMRIKVQGKMDLIPGAPEMPFTLEDTWHMPDQYKSTITFQSGGTNVATTRVIDGDKGWVQVMGKIQDMPKEGLAEMKEQKYAEDLDRLGFLKEKGFDLSLLKEIKIEDKVAVGVLVKAKDHRDVQLYFDKETGLLIKRENKLEVAGKEISQEVFFSDYQQNDGLKHYRKIVAHHNGKKIIEAKVLELEFFDKLDAKVFGKPRE